MHDPLVATLVVGSLLVVGLLVIGPPVSRYPTPADPNSHSDPKPPTDDSKPATDARTLVVDRITNDEAVLLVEAEDGTIDSRRVPVESLPVAGRDEGAVLHETATGYAVDSDATTLRSKNARRRFRNLSKPLAAAARRAVG